MSFIFIWTVLKINKKQKHIEQTTRFNILKSFSAEYSFKLGRAIYDDSDFQRYIKRRTRLCGNLYHEQRWK